MHHGQRRSSRVGLLERQLCHELLEDRQLLATDLLASFESQIPFSSRPRELLAAEDHVFFQADFSFGEGNQLWRTDGTPEGTISLNHKGVIREYVEVDGKFVFLAADQTIRASDGAPQSTTILATESTLGEVSTQVVKYGEHAFFAGQGRGNKRLVLYRTDGTTAGTQVFADLSSIGSVSSHELIGGLGDFFYFNLLIRPSSGGPEREQLWRSDGTTAGTELVSDNHRLERIGPVVEFNGALLFAANLVEPVKPVNSGTAIKGDIDGDRTVGFPDFLILSANFGMVGAAAGDIDGDGQVAFPDFLILSANFGQSVSPAAALTDVSDRELWMISTAGVELVKDIAPGRVGVSNDPDPTASSHPDEMVVGGDTLYFAANDGTHGRELWKTDGTAAGTQMVDDVLPGTGGSDPTWLTWFDDKLFFSARGEIWSYDAGSDTTKIVRDFNASRLSLGPAWLTAYEDQIIFTADDGQGDEVWTTDGTPAGTKLLKETAPGAVSGEPRWFTVLGDQLLFTARSPEAGVELWTSDGTPAGTKLLRDVRTGNQKTFLVPGGLVEFQDLLYFRLHDPEHGAELWRSDGTVEGTELFMELRPTEAGSGPRDFFEYGEHLYFSADDGEHGSELWRTDGTRAGTEMVFDIWTGVDGSVPSDFFVFGADLYFTANNEDHGRELWRTTGGAEPALVPEPLAGSADSGIHDLTLTDNRLFFVAQDPETPGAESIWFLDENGDAPIRLDDEFDRQFPGSSRRWGGLTAFGDELMFREIRTNGSFRGFYLTDGTIEVTRRLSPSPLPSGSPSDLEVTTVAFDGFLFDTVSQFGRQTLIRIDPSRNVSEVIASSVKSFRQSGDLLFLAFEDGRLGVLEEGSTSRTTIADFAPANITQLVPHETGVFVETWSTDGASPSVSIWNSDGTVSGTSKLLESNDFSSIKELHRAANSLFFVGSHRQLGNRVWAVPLNVIGDVNDDMIANQDAIDAIFAAVRDGRDDDRFDLNEDDAVTVEDATYFIETVLETRHGDLDLNGSVEFADFLRLDVSFGNDDASWAEGDLDGDTTVGFADFLTLAANFGFRRPQ